MKTVRNDDSGVDPLKEFEVTEESTTTTDPEDNIPEKYRGKSISELVTMHQEAEKLLGKHSNEVGELRKLVDDVVRMQAQSLKETPKETSDEIDELEWYTQPAKAVERVVEKKLAEDPRIKEATRKADNLTKQDAVKRLLAKHPDAKAIAEAPQFAAWVKESPIRIDLYNRAMKYDMDAADELYTNFKAAHPQTESVKSAPPKTVKDASTGDIRGGQSPKGKVYRREDIVKLMKTDPARYKRLLPEIERAYQEGRVR